MNGLWSAILNPRSPRYETWLPILGEGAEVPLERAATSRAKLGPEEDVEVYRLAISELTPEQRRRLVDWIAASFGASREDVDLELNKTGFPIREADVIVAYSMRAFL